MFAKTGKMMFLFVLGIVPINLAQATVPSRTSSLTEPNNQKIALDTTGCGSGTPRDKFLWPFACNSIWNMPIGSGAQYVSAYIGSKGVSGDTEWIVPTKASDPLVSTYMPGSWGPGRCTGTKPQQQAQWHPEASQPLNVPFSLIIPDATATWTPNSSSAFIKPDGRTITSFTTTARCQQGGPLYGNWFGQTDIYSTGITGGRGGSGLSSLGGTIRKGELFSSQPIRHALKIVVWGKWLNYTSGSSTPGYRWPAIFADSAASSTYKGTNSALEMGSLLAIPPNVTASSLGVTSAVGQKVFQALQNYGAYVVDDAGWDRNYLCIGKGAVDEYKSKKGYSLDEDSALQADFAKMIAQVKVVNNNGPSAIGGGGTPRAPLAPPIGN